MSNAFDEVKVSVALLIGDDPPEQIHAMRATIGSAVNQDHASVEVLIVDGRGEDARPDAQWTHGRAGERIRHLPGRFVNRAAMLNTALQAATGDYLLAVFDRAHQITLRRSAIKTLVMAAVRADDPGMVYADYERIDADGKHNERHLLDWHAGRLLDTADFGPAILFSINALRDAGGFEERYHAADVYDMRLKVTETHPVVHVANRFAGSLYAVRAPGTAHNVFDYLLQDQGVQREMEDALTQHLKRVGAYLEPGVHVRKAHDATSPAAPDNACVASVIIPVNNRPEFIDRAIQSVLDQTIRAVEVIVVVNGGPDDPTIPAVRRRMDGGDRYDPGQPAVRLIVVDINNLGLCLNTGLAAAHGAYYVQLDSDDRLKPDAVEKLLAVYASDPTVAMVIGSYEVWVLDESTGRLTRDVQVPVVTHDEWTADNGRNNLLRVGGAGAPRSARIEAIAGVGWFGVNDDPQCRNYGEDYDLVLRMSERYTIGRVWDPIYEVIRHAGGTDHSIDQDTIDRNEQAKDMMRLHALRRRQRLNGWKGPQA